jgi:hypothetical protein
MTLGVNAFPHPTPLGVASIAMDSREQPVEQALFGTGIQQLRVAACDSAINSIAGEIPSRP